MKRIMVADVMTRDPVTIKTTTNLLDCAKKMVRKRVGSLLIVEGKKLVGFVSRKDILWALIKKSKQDLSKIKAIDISPKKISTIKPTLTLSETIRRMKKLKFDRFPVVSEGKLVGMVTAKDILNFNPEVYPELEEFAKVREEWSKLRRIKKAKDRKELHEGLCEECGNHGMLFKINGVLMCESCRSSI